MTKQLQQAEPKPEQPGFVLQQLPCDRVRVCFSDAARRGTCPTVNRRPGSALLAGTRVQTYTLPGRNYREIGLAWRQGSTRGAEFRQLGEHVRQLAGVETRR